jgi:hypothetical protein
VGEALPAYRPVGYKLIPRISVPVNKSPKSTGQNFGENRRHYARLRPVDLFFESIWGMVRQRYKSQMVTVKRVASLGFRSTVRYSNQLSYAPVRFGAMGLD